MRPVDLPPYAPAFMESSRSIGYSLEAAVSDIIDNSITAHAGKVEVNFFPDHPNGPYVYILDNGEGMTESKLEEAMRYGYRSPSDKRDDDDLGRFGLGLKMASLSQCKRVSVISKLGEDIAGRAWDIDHVVGAEKWEALAFDKDDFSDVPGFDKLTQLDNGVLVVWQNLDRLFTGDLNPQKALGEKMDRVREHLALVFHRYLTGEPGLKKLQITFNGRPVEPADPFLIKKSTQIMDDEIIRIEGAEIRVKPYTLPHSSKLTKEELDKVGGEDGLRRNQGFYVYRNKRLLVWGTWFRLMRQADLSKLARIQVDIPNSLDDLWSLDVKKSVATPPEIVRKNLSLIIKKVAEGSKRTWTYRGKKEVNHPEKKLWNRMISRDKAIFYEINVEHPMISAFIEKHPDAERQLKSIFKELEGCLPLNQLYVDLTNDEKISNENAVNETNILIGIKNYLADYSDQNKKLEILSMLRLTEPFNEYDEMIEEAIKRGELP